MGVCSALESEASSLSMPRFCLALLILPCLLLASCQSHPATDEQHLQSQALVKRVGKYAWRVQLTVREPGKEYERTVWFTLPHAGITPVPLEDCTEVSARASYPNDGRWIQPGGPRWHGYMSYDPDKSPKSLELRSIERSDCACRHFEHSDLSGIHPVKKLGLWKRPPAD
jgi:hypothetical protein